MKRLALVPLFVLCLPLAASADPDCAAAGAPCRGRSHTHVVDKITFTWRYSCDGGDCQHGRFLDGTGWVRNPSGGNVLIETVTPDDLMSGLEKNPATGNKGRQLRQGLYAGAGADSIYEESLDLSRQLPYTAPPDDGVYVKAKAFLGGDCDYTDAVGAKCLETFDALTVVRSLPSDGRWGRSTFRPGMAGDNKLWLTTADFDLGRLPRFAEVTSGNYEAIANRWGAPFPSFYNSLNGDVARRWTPMARQLPNYAADRAALSLTDMFRLFSNDPLTDAKSRAVYAMLQYGQDLFSAYSEGVSFRAGAGQGQGFWHPIVFWGALIRDSSVQERIRAASARSGGFGDLSGIQFTELYQVHRGVHGRPIWGDSCGAGGLAGGNGFYWEGYTAGVRGGSGNRRTCADPYGYIDGPSERPGSLYAQCCSAGIYVSIGLTMRIWPEFERVANYPAMREFAERLMDGAGWWVAEDQVAGIDPRESDLCSPYRDARTTCNYFGVTWGQRADGTPVTISDARAAGHPEPGPRWRESEHHLQGRPKLLRALPGSDYWDRLRAVAGQTSGAPRNLRIQ